MKIDNYLSKTIAVDKDENLSFAMEKMEKNNIQDIPVTNEGKYIGKLSYLNLAEELGSMRKGNKPASQLHVATAYSQNGSLLSSKTSLKAAASELVTRNSSILLVKDKKKKNWILKGN
ncbi:hypothetical protein C9439_05985 [archaeon SCG-AAA382B04]|nr:hypothetical protein C9439_05985 [archaeon SCG-AAA382B04]